MSTTATVTARRPKADGAEDEEPEPSAWMADRVSPPSDSDSVGDDVDIDDTDTVVGAVVGVGTVGESVGVGEGAADNFDPDPDPDPDPPPSIPTGVTFPSAAKAQSINFAA